MLHTRLYNRIYVKTLEGGLDSVVDNLKIVPSSVELVGADIELIGIEDREHILKNNIEEISDDYDYIIIDCPPSLNVLTVNAMAAANSVIVPIQCEFYALEGLSQLLYTINLVRERLNPNLVMDGVVFTMYDARTNLSLQVVENVRKNLKQNIFTTIIPRNVRLAEAPSHGLPICMYDKKSVGEESYDALALEVLENDKIDYTDNQTEDKQKKKGGFKKLFKKKTFFKRFFAS